VAEFYNQYRGLFHDRLDSLRFMEGEIMKYIELEEILKGSQTLAKSLKLQQDNVASLLTYAYNTGIIEGLAQAKRQLGEK